MNEQTTSRSNNKRRASDRGDGSKRPRRGSRRGREQEAPREFEQKILDLSRVTRVTAGGKRLTFRCALVIGDRNGRVGFGVAKGADVQIAVEKAYRQAKKQVLTVPMVNGTIAHPVWMKYGAAVILLKPAPKGTGIKAGGAVRVVLEYAGVPNVVSKITRSSNKINIARATLAAIELLRHTKIKTHKKDAVSHTTENETQQVEAQATTV